MKNLYIFTTSIATACASTLLFPTPSVKAQVKAQEVSPSSITDKTVGWHKSSSINKDISQNTLKLVCYNNKIIGWINNQRGRLF
ncbi:MAG: hypothetical protein HC908_00975 [Calothrix sp. SM1_7_51]|nr:hypothetical protein [Calothrix sp. SM1_7_51]